MSGAAARTEARRCCNAGEATSLAEEGRALPLPADLIDDDEIIILMLRPSVLYIPLAALGGLVVIALVTLGLAYVARVQWLSPWVGWTDGQAFGLGVSLAMLRLGWQTLEWWSQVYVLTDRRIIRRMGVLRVSIFQTSLRAIQHTAVFRRVRERLFGLGSIGFATAGTDVFEAFWLMIAQPFAVHRKVDEAIKRYGRSK